MRKVLSVIAMAVLILAGLSLTTISVKKSPSKVFGQQYAECIPASTAVSPFACQSTGYGFFTIAASAQSSVVQTSAVTSTAVIQVQYDYSLGTLLGVTCNTTGQAPFVSARSAGASFTVGTASTFTTNPGCFSFRIISQ